VDGAGVVGVAEIEAAFAGPADADGGGGFLLRRAAVENETAAVEVVLPDAVGVGGNGDRGAGVDAAALCERAVARCGDDLRRGAECAVGQDVAADAALALADVQAVGIV